MDLDLIQHILQSVCRLDSKQIILVGVSGGADSLALLDILHRLNYPLAAAHFNHQLREDANEDARFVVGFAAGMGLPCILGSGDVREIAHRNGLSLEEAARKARYRFLFEQARFTGAQAVAVGHHAGDQVETILMHFLRGSGPAGLRGMQMRTILPEWDGFIPLIRPLLGIEKEEILTYCAERSFHPREDHTNQDTSYYRNRLRLQLIPELEKYNPRFRSSMLRMGEVMAGDEQLLEDAVLAAWLECCREPVPGIVQVSPKAFSRQARAMQRRILRRAANQLLPDLRDVDFDSVERGVNFCAAHPTCGQVDFAGGLIAEADYDGIFVHLAETAAPLNSFPQVEADFEQELPIPGKIDLGGWEIRAEECEQPQDFSSTTNEIAWLDRAVLQGPFIIRRAVPGESFTPLGMGGKSVRLSTFWSNIHMPRRARPGWPLVICQGEIVWVVGQRICDPARLKPSSCKAIRLELVRRQADAA